VGTGGVGRRVEVELLSTSHLHDNVEQQELTGGQGTDHNATGSEADSAQLDEADLTGDSAESGHDGALATGTGLVHLGQQGVGRVGDDGRAHTGNHTGGQGHTELGAADQLSLGLAHGGGHAVSSLALHGELGHGVGDLLHQNGAEAGVEALDQALLGEQLGGTAHEATGEGGLGHEADTGGLQGAQEDISDELGHGGRRQVDGSLVVPGLLVTKILGELHLEELHTTELEPTCATMKITNIEPKNKKRRKIG
jgi:hypothetical protein